MIRFESGRLSTQLAMSKILYLGSPNDFDTETARLLWRWLKEQTGNRGLIIVHPRAQA